MLGRMVSRDKYQSPADRAAAATPVRRASAAPSDPADRGTSADHESDRVNAREARARALLESLTEKDATHWIEWHVRPRTEKQRSRYLLHRTVRIPGEVVVRPGFYVRSGKPSAYSDIEEGGTVFKGGQHAGTVVGRKFVGFPPGPAIDLDGREGEGCHLPSFQLIVPIEVDRLPVPFAQGGPMFDWLLSKSWRS